MDAVTPLRLDKSTFSIGSLTDPSDEREYWRRQSPADRLAALELMRQVMYGYDPVADRLHRVLEVVKRSSG